MEENALSFFGDMDGFLCKWEDATEEEVHKPGFFLTRKPDQTAIDAARILYSKANFRVLSAAFDKRAREEKREWLRLWMPFLKDEDIIFTPYGKAKSESFIEKSPYHVLIDDNSKQLLSWHGPKIKYMNGVNGRFGTYKGEKVWFYETGHKVAKDILEKARVQVMNTTQEGKERSQ